MISDEKLQSVMKHYYEYYATFTMEDTKYQSLIDEIPGLVQNICNLKEELNKINKIVDKLLLTTECSPTTH